MLSHDCQKSGNLSGQLQGNIVANERIEIKAPGKVYGNIQAPKVIIEEGVLFEGNCKMQVTKEGADKKVKVLPQESSKNL